MNESERHLHAVDGIDPLERERAVEEVRKARRKAIRIYNASVGLGTASVGAGVFLVAGLGPALIVIGASALALTLYSAERLHRGAPRVSDRHPDS